MEESQGEVTPHLLEVQPSITEERYAPNTSPTQISHEQTNEPIISTETIDHGAHAKAPEEKSPNKNPQIREESNNSFSNEGLTDAQVSELRKTCGYNEVKAKKVPEWVKIMRRYGRLVPMLLLTAALFSVIVVEGDMRDWMSFSLLVFLCNVMVWADYLGDRSAQDAIGALEKLGAPECNAKRSGEFRVIPVRELVPGDVVWLKGGVVVPADGIFISPGNPLSVNESSLTGESLPVRKHQGYDMLSGAVVETGEGEMLVKAIGADSFYGKTILLLSRAERKGNMRMVLDKTARIITSMAGLFAVFLFFWQMYLPSWTLGSPTNWGWVLVKRGFILVASVAPAAMPVVTTTVLAVGALAISKEGGIVSRLSAIEEAAGVSTLCTDKTGTLTLNVLTLNKTEIFAAKGYTNEQVLMYASLASSVVDPEAIDKAINASIDMSARASYSILSYLAFSPTTKRTEACVCTPEGTRFTVSKGAPHVIRDLVCVDDSESTDVLRESINNYITDKAKRGLRTLGVAMKNGEDEDWALVGYMCLFDPPRSDTAETIKKAKALGIRIKMVTGDQQAIAQETAHLLGMGQAIAGPDLFTSRGEGAKLDREFANAIDKFDGFSGVYPEHKFAIVDALQESGEMVAMTGDGVNDAPALKRATIGIAVSGSTEAARAAADVILLTEGLSCIITVMSLSRQIFKRVESYITFRISTSLLVVLFCWGCVVFFRYQFPSWTLVLVSMINDFVLMSCAHDKVPSCKSPMVWSMLRVTLVAIWMAVVGAACILVYIGLSDPAFGVNWWHLWGLEDFESNWLQPEPGVFMSFQTNAGVWLLITLIIQFKFHSARTQGIFCHYTEENQTPSVIILIPQGLAVVLTLGLTLCWDPQWRIASGSPMQGISWGHAGVTILWSLVWFLFLDISKVFFHRFVWPAIANNKIVKRMCDTTPHPSKDELLFRHRVRIAMRELEATRKERQRKRRENEKKFRIQHLNDTENKVDKKLQETKESLRAAGKRMSTRVYKHTHSKQTPKQTIQTEDLKPATQDAVINVSSHAQDAEQTCEPRVFHDASEVLLNV